MVLQRNINIPVWGNAKPGALITATLGKVNAVARADNDGEWILRFPKFKVGGPYDLKITETGKLEFTISLKGILIGDVWLASGQSNMEWQVQQAQDAQKEIAKANYRNIRFLIVEHNKEVTPQKDILAGKWKVCDSATIKDLSAVAYYFARKIHQDENVPIGIIQSTWGGTPVESWTSREMLLSSPISKTKALANDTLTKKHFEQDSLDMVRFWDIVYNPKGDSDKIIPLPQYDDRDWSAVEMPGLIKDFRIGSYEGLIWMRKKIVLPPTFTGKDIALNIGRPEMNYSLYFNGAEICKTVWNSAPKHLYTIPASLVKSGENTISIRIAALWAGGGINAPAGDIYLTNGNTKVSLAGTWLFKRDIESRLPVIRNYQNYPEVLYNAMIKPIIPYGIKGFIWYQGEANESNAYDYRTLFPMMINDWRQRWQQGNLPFLYVQLANFRNVNDLPSESGWAEVRDAQTSALTQPNTGMASAIDIGEADNIHPKNKQEVGRRLALAAERQVYGKSVVASGPMYKSYTIKKNIVTITFKDFGAGLTIRSGPLKGFAIAGADKKFYWASASIKGNKVVVSSDKVTAPVAVRYAWADNPVCNLVNNEGLPAVPFRTDTWKLITEK